MDVNFASIFVLVTLFSIDEIMIYLMGESTETRHMKNKPINEGFKIFFLVAISSFVVNFTPYGKIPSKKVS